MQRDLQRDYPPGADRDPVAGSGRQREEQTNMGTESDAGMRSGVKRQATEADRRRVQATLTSRWAALCTGRKSKERAKLRGFQRGTDG